MPFQPQILETRAGLVLVWVPETDISVEKVLICEQRAWRTHRGSRYIVGKDPSMEAQVRAIFDRMVAGTITVEEVRDF